MSELEKKLVDAYKKGRLLEAAFEFSTVGDKGHREATISALVALNNEHDIDVVGVFSSLENNDDFPNFFFLRSLLEHALAQLDSPILDVMKCVLHLTEQAGNDLTSNMLITPFIDYCSESEGRACEALKILLDDPSNLADMLSPILVAGAIHNLPHYLNEAILLSTHSDEEIQKRAIFALGKLKYQSNLSLTNKVVDRLEEYIDKESDDQILGTILKSAFELYIQNNDLKKKITKVICDSLDKGNDYALHAASEIFGFNSDKVPKVLMKVLTKHIATVNPDNKGTLDNVDYGLIKLLSKDEPKQGIELLEKLLITNKGKVNINAFKHTKHSLFRNESKILNRLATRWLFNGQPPLCFALQEIIRCGNENGIVLQTVSDEITHKNLNYIIFIARKAIGFLFYQPVTATSIILSLIPYIKDSDGQSVLTEYIFDPLLLNYPGKVKDYIDSVLADKPDEAVRNVCETAIEKFEEYISNLDSTHDITEHRPSLRNQESYKKHFSRKMNKAMKEAEKKSVLLNLVNKSVLLYGRKSISYQSSPVSPANRIEMPLSNFTTTMEIPRLQNIDPVGLEYLLRIYRYEVIRK